MSETPPVCDYEGSTYQQTFWDTGQRAYEDQSEARALRALLPGGGRRLLEIGAGAGRNTPRYTGFEQVVVLDYSRTQLEQARARLARLGYTNVEVRVGDGYKGWPEKGPFDAVILTAAPPYIPQPLIDQLKVGGKMVAPVGEYFQDLLVITKTADGIEKRTVIPVRLVPMTGEVRDRGR